MNYRHRHKEMLKFTTYFEPFLSLELVCWHSVKQIYSFCTSEKCQKSVCMYEVAYNMLLNILILVVIWNPLYQRNSNTAGNNVK
jgi:hypothetical protein